MSGKKTYQQEKQIFRYLRNQMTDLERNAFERELQRDSFLFDALEGFGKQSARNSELDILDIKANLKQRDNRKRFLWLSVAASVLVILVSTFLVRNIEKRNHQFAMDEIQMKELEQISPEMEEEEGNLVIEEQKLIAKSKKNRQGDYQEYEELNEFEISDEESDFSIEIPEQEQFSKFPSTRENLNFHMENRVQKPKERVEIPSALETAQAVMLVNDSNDLVLSKGKSVQNNFLFIDQAESSSDSDFVLDEAVVTAYGVQNKHAVTGAISSIDVREEAVPVGGWENYQAYLDSACIQSQVNSGKRRRIVKVSFKVSKEGQPEEVKIIRSSKEEYNSDAIRIIQNGPAWLPKTEGYFAQPSEVKLKLVFPASSQTKQ